MGMSYQSPIEVITSAMRISSENTINGEIVKAVQNVGISVDKAELMRALAYDRHQYANGYADGRAARDEEIVRCKDCKYWSSLHECQLIRNLDNSRMPDWFCADGVRKDGADK